MRCVQKKTTWCVFRILLAAVVLTLPASLLSQDLRTTLFQKTDTAYKAAEAVQAEFLAPRSFSKAVELYTKADNEFSKGKNLDSIRSKLKEAEKYFVEALNSSKLAETTFGSVIKAKSDAESIDAEKFSGESWAAAGEKFKSAAMELESGDIKNARKKGAEAEQLYRDAELATVKANFLDETRELLATADKQNVKKFAPKALSKAKELLQTAEIELERNRYDTDYPRSIARQAKYEVKHAIYLANTITQLKDDKSEFEDLLLLGESPLEKIAGMAGIVAEFDVGYGRTADLIVDHISSQEETIISVKQELTDKTRETVLLQESIAELQTNVKKLNEQLGGVQKEKSELAQKIEAERLIKEKYDKIGKIFTKSEAQVLRTPDNDLIIRLIGLNFESGKDEIKAEYSNLLIKVKQAIEIFPENKLKIEGHTDSFGGDQFNLELSQKRADAIKSYFIMNMGIEAAKIHAAGFGETKPIANNETRQGRAKNRRIDIIIMNR